MMGEPWECLIGQSAGREVLLGFASAKALCAASFADVLDEATGLGYQRRLNVRHSLDFRRYIRQPTSSTIPLTLNLRPTDDGVWHLERMPGGRARLHLRSPLQKLFAQVDCQHRLGHMSDVDLVLPFMSFIGLDIREETEVFNVINSKARGLSTSLLDFHDASLIEDLGKERPELYIAMYLRNEPASPWYQQLDLGGASASGMERRASLRTVQKAVRNFLSRSDILSTMPVDSAASVVLAFWTAVTLVLPGPWLRPRKHMINKGVGVYALMEIAADLVREASGEVSARYFSACLSDFAVDFDWSSDGPLRGLGGESGVREAVSLLRNKRKQYTMRAIGNG